MKPLEQSHIMKILRNALDVILEEAGENPLAQVPCSSQTENDRTPLHPKFPNITEEALGKFASFSLGDARVAQSLLEIAANSPPQPKPEEFFASLKQTVVVPYDREGEAHYNCISALHKSIRGSNGDAAMFWLARMLNGGEDPVYIARRLVVIASEDVGLASENALPLVSCPVMNQEESTNLDVHRLLQH